MAAEHIIAARKANAFARLGDSRLAIATALGIENGETPKFKGDIARNPELLHIAQLESVNEFLEQVRAIIEENTVEGDSEAESALDELRAVLNCFALPAVEGQEPETLLQILYRLTSSRTEWMGASLEAARCIAHDNGLETPFNVESSPSDVIAIGIIKPLRDLAEGFQTRSKELALQVDETTAKLTELTARIAELEANQPPASAEPEAKPETETAPEAESKSSKKSK